MASNVVNLNKFRKKKQREEKAKQAEINRARHGRTNGEKQRELADRDRAERTLDGAHLGPPESEAGEAPSEEPPEIPPA
jgi:hypothetical protein